MQDLIVMITMIDASQGGCVPTGGTSRLHIDVNGDTQIHYSSEAIAKLGSLLDVIKSETDVRVTQSFIEGSDDHEAIEYEVGIVEDDGEDADPNATGQTMVGICHKPGMLDMNKVVPMPALAGHLGHGDTMGPCPQ